MHSAKRRKKLNGGILFIIIKKSKKYDRIIETRSQSSKIIFALAIRRIQVKHWKCIKIKYEKISLSLEWMDAR